MQTAGVAAPSHNLADGTPFRMDIDAINGVLQQEQFSEMVVQSFGSRGRTLVIAFMPQGGPREDQAYVVEFHETILFHLPSVLYAPVLFRRAAEAERERFIPPISYDAEESRAPRTRIPCSYSTTRAGLRTGTIWRQARCRRRGVRLSHAKLVRAVRGKPLRASEA